MHRCGLVVLALALVAATAGEAPARPRVPNEKVKVRIDFKDVTQDPTFTLESKTGALVAPTGGIDLSDVDKGAIVQIEFRIANVPGHSVTFAPAGNPGAWLKTSDDDRGGLRHLTDWKVGPVWGAADRDAAKTKIRVCRINSVWVSLYALTFNIDGKDVEYDPAITNGRIKPSRTPVRSRVQCILE